MILILRVISRQLKSHVAEGVEQHIAMRLFLDEIVALDQRIKSTPSLQKPKDLLASEQWGLLRRAALRLTQAYA
jgi:hypothetical protein